MAVAAALDHGPGIGTDTVPMLVTVLFGWITSLLSAGAGGDEPSGRYCRDGVLDGIDEDATTATTCPDRFPSRVRESGRRRTGAF